MKYSYTEQLSNLPMLGSDSKKTHIFPNIKNVSFVSLQKLRDDKCGTRLTKNQCTFHKDNTPIMITPRYFKTVKHVMNLTQHMLRNESKESKSLFIRQ